MATAVSIAIRKADAQARIQQASIELAAKYGLGQVQLAPTHKQPDIQAVLTLEAVAAFLEDLAAAEPVPVKKRKAQAAD
jgi:hypothetical protein